MVQLHNDGKRYHTLPQSTALHHLYCAYSGTCHLQDQELDYPLSIAMKQRGPMATVHYRFLSKMQKWVALAMKSFSSVNPFSHQVE